MVGVTERTVRNWMRANQLAAIQLGGVVRISFEDLQRAMKQKS